MLFVDRTDAGRHLAQRLRHLRRADVVVLGLPRGGVPVAFEVAENLHAPLDVIAVRKLGVPFQPEYGFGAIGEGSVRIVDDHVVRQTRLTEAQLAEVEARERALLDRRVSQLRGDNPPVPLAGRTVIVDSTTLRLAQQRRMGVWLWSVDTQDWMADGSGSAYWVNRIIRLAEQEGGALRHPIVLMHNQPNGNPATVSALPAIIQFFRAHGYRFVAL